MLDEVNTEKWSY